MATKKAPTKKKPAPRKKAKKPAAKKSGTGSTTIPSRTLGRVSDKDFEFLKRAAASTGETFTQWAMTTLMAEARRLKTKYPA